jgi:hypothetical protein
MAEEKKTWNETLMGKLTEFETYLKDMQSSINKKHNTLMDNWEQLVELSKKVHEPGMDYYGTDYLSQMGVGLKVAELENMSNPVDYEEKLDALLKDAGTRLFWLKREVEQKEKVT